MRDNSRNGEATMSKLLRHVRREAVCYHDVSYNTHGDDDKQINKYDSNSRNNEHTVSELLRPFGAKPSSTTTSAPRQRNYSV